jgi:hypothetical protein
MNRAAAGDFKGMQELMQIAHDGDRVSQWDAARNKRVAFESVATDRDLQEWIDDPASNPIWQKPGYFERSIEPVDHLCDLIAERFCRVATGRIAGAGLGGAVTVLAKSESVEEIREFLSSAGYRSIPPLTPGQGASTIG